MGLVTCLDEPSLKQFQLTGLISSDLRFTKALGPPVSISVANREERRRRRSNASALPPSASIDRKDGVSPPLVYYWANS